MEYSRLGKRFQSKHSKCHWVAQQNTLFEDIIDNVLLYAGYWGGLILKLHPENIPSSQHSFYNDLHSSWSSFLIIGIHAVFTQAFLCCYPVTQHF